MSFRRTYPDSDSRAELFPCKLRKYSQQRQMGRTAPPKYHYEVALFHAMELLFACYSSFHSPVRRFHRERNPFAELRWTSSTYLRRSSGSLWYDISSA